MWRSCTPTPPSAPPAWTPTGPGRWQSAGTAVYMATEKVIDKARAIAAHQLEASEDDLEFSGGTFRRCGARPRPRCRWRGSPSRRSPPTDLPDGMEPNLEAHVTYDPPNFTFPNGTHNRGGGGGTPTPATWTWWTTWRWTTAGCRSTR